jgi:hypothetical protein
VTIYLPEGTKAKLNEKFQYHYRGDWMIDDALNLGSLRNNTFQIKNGKAVCLDCPVVDETESGDSKSNKVIDSTTTTDGKWKYTDEDDEKVSMTKPLTVGGVEVGKVTVTKTKKVGPLTFTKTETY